MPSGEDAAVGSLRLAAHPVVGIVFREIAQAVQSHALCVGQGQPRVAQHQLLRLLQRDADHAVRSPGGDHVPLLRGDVPAALRPAGQHRRQIHVLRPGIGAGQKPVGAPAGDHVEEAPAEPVQLRRRQRCGAVGSGDGNRLRRGGLRRSNDRDRLRRFGSRCGRGSPSAGTQARQHHQSQQDRTKPFHGSSFLPDAHWFALRLYHTEFSGQIHHEMMKNIYKPVTVRLKISGISCIVFTSRRLQTRRR